MATRMYYHSTASTEGGILPTVTQSSKTATQSYESQATNRTLTTTIGSAQASIAFTNTTNTGNNRNYYVSKFISPELNQAGIAANTWRYNFASKHSSLSVVDDYPTTDDNAPLLPICVYVWRPSTGAKVANIFDSTVTGYVDSGNFTSAGHVSQQTTSEIAEDGTFAGVAVAGATVGDVIISEVWISVWTHSTTSVTLSWFYDGGTETLTDGTVVADHASFLETPENITFSTPGTGPTNRQYNSYSNTGFMPSVASVTF